MRTSWLISSGAKNPYETCGNLSRGEWVPPECDIAELPREMEEDANMESSKDEVTSDGEDVEAVNREEEGTLHSSDERYKQDHEEDNNEKDNSYEEPDSTKLDFSRTSVPPTTPRPPKAADVNRQ